MQGSSAEETMQKGSHTCCNLNSVFQQSLICDQSFTGSLLEGLYSNGKRAIEADAVPTSSLWTSDARRYLVRISHS